MGIFSFTLSGCLPSTPRRFRFSFTWEARNQCSIFMLLQAMLHVGGLWAFVFWFLYFLLPFKLSAGRFSSFPFPSPPLQSILHINRASDFVLFRANVNTHSIAIVLFIRARAEGMTKSENVRTIFMLNNIQSINEHFSRAFWCDYHNWKSLIVKQKLCSIAFMFDWISGWSSSSVLNLWSEKL